MVFLFEVINLSLPISGLLEGFFRYILFSFQDLFQTYACIIGMLAEGFGDDREL